MVSVLAPAMDQPRISQVLPTVKCSSCNQPVALVDLGEHVCVKPPPVPSLPKIPSQLHASSVKPPSTRVTSPGLPIAGPPPARFATPPIQPPRSPQPSRGVPYETERPRISTGPSSPSFPQRSSPLAQHSRNDTSTPLNRHPQPAPLRTNLPNPPPSPWSTDGHGRTYSNISTRTPISPNHSGLPYPHGTPPSASTPSSSPLAPPPSIPVMDRGRRVASFVPESEVGIDTKTGGEAGMAGVGRRGFAAAVRAAMFVSPASFPMDRRAYPPRHLDIDAASRSTDTPPLSAGSGYSSHSPGPLSPGPQADLLPEPSPKSLGSPSPAQTLGPPHLPHLPPPSKSPADEIARGTNLSPLDRLPFFGKYKNMLPGLSTSPDSYLDSDGNPSIPVANNVANNHRSDDNPRLRNLSVSTVTSLAYNRGVDKSLQDDSDSGSECGLAYADSTDDEGEILTPGSNNHPTSILRSGSTATGRRVHFPESSRSRAGSDSSSYSSASEAGQGGRTAIAQALGISTIKQESVTGLGGGRQRSSSASSIDTRSIYSRTTSIGPMSGPFDKGTLQQTMETLMEEEVVIGEMPEESSQLRSQDVGSAPLSPVLQPQRSNTVQVPPHSPENQPPKLPTRAKTTTEHNKILLEPPAIRKEKVRRTRVCLRCEKKIEDGRWIKVDTGGALCENCWKNMYLPKCRRCQLPIEKQAVSSADGQLKGKYHKECFNCHVCHKSFPDKSFYVYDGKPLCAYHYHEANDSLCAAARCGQPIEGPCAVSHAGDRYHPEHMTCEYPGATPCAERLKEYWEVDGRMLCEKHAARAGDEDDDGDWIQTSSAKKRVTRFMNLGNDGVLSDLL